MNCEQAVGLLADRLNDQLGEPDAARLAAHLATCADCRAEADAMTAIWSELDTRAVDVPHERMRARFHAALAAYEERANRAGIERLIDVMWPTRPMLQAALGLALLLIGVFLGRSSPGLSNAEITAMREEIRGMSLALLEHQSASQRLRGVGVSRRTAASGPVVDALIDTVRRDSNVNVRLAAIEALSGWLDQPDVGAALIDTLSEQQAPLVQVALAQALLEAEIADSVPAVERLIARDGVDPAVRDYLSATLLEVSSRAPTDQRL